MHLNPRIAALLSALNNPSLPGIDLSLERMWQLLAALGNPQEQLPPVIHIAGTNGKGSTLAYVRAIYAAAGYRVHAYTSPHLVRFNERILLSGQEIDDSTLLPLLEQVSAAAKDIPVTFFEATTAAALLAFEQHPADVVLLETGLGGRLDATNVVAAPMMSAITPIDYDHMEFLGDSLAAIAQEKAGIIKPSVPCAVGAQPAEAMAVIARIAQQHGAPLHLLTYVVGADGITVTAGADSWTLPLPALEGAHQCHNAALASLIVRRGTLPVNDAQMRDGVATAHWPARLQRLTYGPLVQAWGARGAVMLDGGHNPSAARALRAWIDTQHAPVTLLLGMMARKDAQAFLAPLMDVIRGLITVPIADNDCYTPQELLAFAGGRGVAVATLADAPAALLTSAEGTLLIAGSLFLAGEVLKNHG
ncbi:MAG: folylpolyglutamate synthase/dihydrofolate synthase family protein [Pseudomonadota bacterium]